MYVAVKGGQQAIEAAHEQLAQKRRGDTALPELSVAQIQQQLPYAVDRVMTEGSLFDPELAALAIKQAAGDLIEAIFLLRAYRTTLPRFVSSQPLDTATMRVERRISATFKDIPGGQILGPTQDYSHRLLDFSLLEEGDDTRDEAPPENSPTEPCPGVLQILCDEDLVEQETSDASQPQQDMTEEPLEFPAGRSARPANMCS